MAEGWLRHYAKELSLNAEVFSAGTEQTFVKPDAITVMQEVGIDLLSHSSKTLEDLPEKWNFDVVMTVCNNANETCPVYPAKTNRLHVSFPDPSGSSLATWRDVRDAIGRCCKTLIETLVSGKTLLEADLQAVSIKESVQ
jgi:arsenate reductase